MFESWTVWALWYRDKNNISPYKEKAGKTRHQQKQHFVTKTT